MYVATKTLGTWNLPTIKSILKPLFNVIVMVMLMSISLLHPVHAQPGYTWNDVVDWSVVQQPGFLPSLYEPNLADLPVISLRELSRNESASKTTIQYEITNLSRDPLTDLRVILEDEHNVLQHYGFEVQGSTLHSGHSSEHRVSALAPGHTHSFVVWMLRTENHLPVELVIRCCNGDLGRYAVTDATTEIEVAEITHIVGFEERNLNAEYPPLLQADPAMEGEEFYDHPADTVPGQIYVLVPIIRGHAPNIPTQPVVVSGEPPLQIQNCETLFPYRPVLDGSSLAVLDDPPPLHERLGYIGGVGEYQLHSTILNQPDFGPFYGPCATNHRLAVKGVGAFPNLDVHGPEIVMRTMSDGTTKALRPVPMHPFPTSTDRYSFHLGVGRPATPPLNSDFDGGYNNSGETLHQMIPAPSVMVEIAERALHMRGVSLTVDTADGTINLAEWMDDDGINKRLKAHEIIRAVDQDPLTAAIASMLVISRVEELASVCATKGKRFDCGDVLDPDEQELLEFFLLRFKWIAARWKEVIELERQRYVRGGTHCGHYKPRFTAFYEETPVNNFWDALNCGFTMCYAYFNKEYKGLHCPSKFLSLLGGDYFDAYAVSINAYGEFETRMTEWPINHRSREMIGAVSLLMHGTGLTHGILDATALPVSAVGKHDTTQPYTLTYSRDDLLEAANIVARAYGHPEIVDKQSEHSLAENVPGGFSMVELTPAVSGIPSLFARAGITPSREVLRLIHKPAFDLVSQPDRDIAEFAFLNFDPNSQVYAEESSGSQMLARLENLSNEERELLNANIGTARLGILYAFKVYARLNSLWGAVSQFSNKGIASLHKTLKEIGASNRIEMKRGAKTLDLAKGQKLYDSGKLFSRGNITDIMWGMMSAVAMVQYAIASTEESGNANTALATLYGIQVGTEAASFGRKLHDWGYRGKAVPASAYKRLKASHVKGGGALSVISNAIDIGLAITRLVQDQSPGTIMKSATSTTLASGRLFAAGFKVASTLSRLKAIGSMSVFSGPWNVATLMVETIATLQISGLEKILKHKRRLERFENNAQRVQLMNLKGFSLLIYRDVSAFDTIHELKERAETENRGLSSAEQEVIESLLTRPVDDPITEKVDLFLLQSLAI